MVNQNSILSKTLVIGILILLIGMSVVSSIENKVEDGPAYCSFMESFDNSEELLIRGKIAYGYIADPAGSGLPEGPCFFALDDPGNLTSLKPTSSGNILTGGTWSTDIRWRCCEYGSGCLWEIDPETGDMWSIGGGGTSCNGLAWDLVFTRLYATDGSNLIEYVIETGEQELIGSHGQPGTMIGLAINKQGVCYTWNASSSGTSTLFTVDLDSGEADEVASMGENLYGAGDGAFDWHTGILYISASGQLMTCDVETGELTLIGDFEGGAEITALAIPFYWGFPQANFIWTPIHPNPGQMILFNASTSYDQDGYITLYSWDWDNDGVFDENYTSPTSTHTFHEVGYYPVTLRVKDNDNRTFDKTKTVRVGNYPPYEPSNPYPENEARYVPVDAILNWTGGDPDPGDDVLYDVYFSRSYPPIIVSNNQTSTCFDPYGSCDMPLFEEFFWKIVAWDNHGASTAGQIWNFTTDPPTPPNKPTITGPTIGIVGVEYEYNFSLSDPDNNSMYLRVDWGSGTPGKWHGPFASDTKVKLNHTWNDKGTYTIKAQAKDINDIMGPWGTVEVKIPRNRATFDSLLYLFLERFPFFEVFLRAMILLR